jgi:hypothetical protein
MKSLFPNLRGWVCLLLILFSIQHAYSAGGILSDCTKPINLSVVEASESSVTLAWLNEVDALEYVVEVKSKARTPKISLKISTTEESLVVNGLEPGGDYKFRVKTICLSGGSSGSTKWHVFTTLGGEPGEGCQKPNNLSVAAIAPDSVVLNWLDQSAMYYEITVKSKNGTPKYYLQTQTQESAFTVRGLIPEGKYKFKVKALCDDGASSGYSNWVVFMTSTMVEPPDTTCPVPLGIVINDITDTSSVIYWIGDTMIVNYEVSITPLDTTDNFQFNNIVQDTFVAVNGLSGSTVYQVKLQSVCAEDMLSNPVFLTFETSETPVDSGMCLVPEDLASTLFPDMNALLVWQGTMAGKYGLELEQITDDSVKWSLDTMVIDTFFITPILMDSSTYQFRVKSICDSISESVYSAWDTLMIREVEGLIDTCLAPTDLSALAVSDSIAVLSWSGPDSTLYRLELRGSDTSSLVLDTMVLDSMLEVGGLMVDQRYLFRVQAVCDSLQTSDYSDWFAFDLLADTVPHDSCKIPIMAMASVLPDSSAKLSWSGTTDMYQIIIDHDLDTIVGAVDSILTDSIYVLFNLMPEVNYRFQVRSICDSTSMSDYTGWVSFSLEDLEDTTRMDSCITPNTLFIEAGQTMATVAWDHTLEGVVYEVEVEQLGLAPEFHFITETLDSNISLTGLTPGQMYQTRITQYCSDTTSAMSDWTIFETEVDSNAMDCPAPLNLSLTGMTEQSAILTWSGAENGYDYEVEIQSLDTTPFLEFYAYTMDTFYLLQGLSHPGLYQVKAISFCKDGSISEDSDWIEFSTISPDSGMVSNRLVNVFPNPAQHQFQIKVPDTGFGPVTYFQLSDILGRVVLSEKRDGLTGQEILSFPVSGLREGVYQLLVRTVEETYSQSIYIAK